MSVLIKGLEMPKEGCYHRICIYPDGAVPIEGRMYEAVPVPPHGDLIDQDEYRDEFMNGVYALCSDDSDNYRANAIIDLFDEAPTVIPASEKERPMTLDEAIQHCEETAEKSNCKCADKHLQLAEWLRKLKRRRSDAPTIIPAFAEDIEEV